MDLGFDTFGGIPKFNDLDVTESIQSSCQIDGAYSWVQPSSRVECEREIDILS